MTKLACLLLVVAALFGGCASNEDDLFRPLNREGKRALAQRLEPDAKLIEELFTGVHVAQVDAVDPNINGTKGQSAALNDAETIKNLGGAIAAAIRDHDGVTAVCWNPRHAIWLQKGERRVLVVICYECQKGYIKEAGESRDFSISRSGEKAFDEVLQKLGLKKVL